MLRSPSLSTVRSRADRSFRRTALMLALVPAVLPAQGASQRTAQSASLRSALPSWIGLVAAPGREQGATDAIMRASSGWTRGPLGQLTRRAGSGSPRRVIACSLDRPAYAVSEIAPDGYLRVHDAEPARQHPLWDQFHEGQRVLVQTRDGVRPGVFGVRSTHLWRRRPPQDAVSTVDNLWLDIGAKSAAEVQALGVRLLDPVVRELPAWTYGSGDDVLIAGPGAAARTGCAAIAAMSGATPARGENVYLIATQSSFGSAGLTAAIARLGHVDELVLASAQPGGDSAATSSGTAELRTPPALRGAVGSSRSIALRARFAGTLVETVRARDVDAFAAALAAAADVNASALAPVVLAAPPAAPSTTAARDAHSLVADLLARLADVYGVAGHEAPIRDAVLAELPAWARSRATVDTAGNLVVAVGPDRDTAVFMAHLDEIGYEVARIGPDGTVSLVPRGGMFNSLWEGQPALLHVGASPSAARADGACGAANGGPLRGVFVPRDSAARKQPAALTAWFGLDSAALVARGVAPGAAVTGYKCASRLAATRFTARSIDDRAGSTALVLALRELDPAGLKHKVIFVWSVREEIGLQGAAAAAAVFGPSVRRVYAVDTFVASDSPLESSRFAHTPLGAGAIVRALDNSSATDPAETDRVLALAKARGIPMQVGTTNGGNDGSELVRYGALDIPLSWPARYSHSPVELIDLRDVRALADIVKALATAP
jgi:putative aminopeptidase FrvX